MSPRLPDGWRDVSLGDIAKLNPASLPSSTPAEYEFRYIDLATVEGPSQMVEPREVRFSDAPSRARRIVETGDILVATVRPYLRGFCRIRDEARDLIASTGFAVIRPTEDVDGEFLYQHILADWFLNHLTPRMKGSNYPAVGTNDVADYRLSLPPLTEQRRIAEILSSVDDTIQAEQAAIDQSCVVRDVLGRHLIANGAGSSETKSWRYGKLENFFVLQRGFDITESQSEPGSVPVISSSGICYFHNTATVPGPAVVTGRKGKLGSVYFSEGPCWPHDTTLWVKDFKGNHPKFVYWYLSHLKLDKMNAATSVPTLNRNNVHSLTGRFPPLEEQKNIATHLDSFESISSQQDVLVRLKSIKAALMADLLTGRKRVTSNLSIAAE